MVAVGQLSTIVFSSVERPRNPCSGPSGVRITRNWFQSRPQFSCECSVFGGIAPPSPASITTDPCGVFRRSEPWTTYMISVSFFSCFSVSPPGGIVTQLNEAPRIPDVLSIKIFVSREVPTYVSQSACLFTTMPVPGCVVDCVLIFQISSWSIIFRVGIRRSRRLLKFKRGMSCLPS